jgi:Secretion system C-terminal sorting domain
MKQLFFFLFALILSVGNLTAQTFTDDYSSSTGWTHQSSGNTIGIQNGSLNFNQTYCGGTDEYMYKPLGFTLDNTKWSMDFEWRGTAGSNIGASALIATLTSQTSDPAYTTPDTSTSVTNNNMISVLYFSCYGCGSSGNGIEILTKRGTSQYVWHNALHIPLPFFETGYIRLERLSANTGMISVFTDSARTQHRAGSPRCFPIQAGITDLQYLQHGTWVPGSNARYTSGRVDNVTIENNVNHSTPNTNATISGNTYLCASNTTVLSANQTVGYNNYVWSDGSTTPSIMVGAPGVYTVTATASNNICVATASKTVAAAPSLPNFQFEVFPATCTGAQYVGSIQVLSPPDSTTYQWSNGWWQTGTAISGVAGVYTVTVTNGYGCTLVQQILIPCASGTAIGRIFADNNQNGVQDSSEINIPNIQVRVSSGATATYSGSDTNGKYYVGVEGIGAQGIYIDDANGGIMTTPLRLAEIASSADVDSLNNDIGLYYPNGVRDLSIYLSSPIIRPGFDFTTTLVYHNNLNTTIYDAEVSFDMTGFTPIFVGATPAPSSVLNGVYTWHIDTLAAFTSGNIALTLKADSTVALNTPFTAHANITPLAGDINVVNNSYTQTGFVRGSFDPNDKKVTPETFNGLANTPDLDYLIRFQNTGTDTAFTVVVRDTLSEFVDITTLKVLGSSHNYTYKIGANRELIFRFNNIMLLDSFTNEPKSHGFVAYRIRPTAAARQTTAIHNTANIYFDYNVPVRTNTATTSIFLANEPAEPTTHSLVLVPNPAYTTAHISTDLTDYTLTITDLLGRTVYQQANIGQPNVEISVTNFAAGQYFIVAQSKTGSVTKKMTVVR